MKKIIVATDFSAAATNAAEYATDMALAVKAGIVLLYVYLPPASSLAKRGIEEDRAREAVTSILTHIPPQMSTIVCGDFNTRIGILAP